MTMLNLLLPEWDGVILGFEMKSVLVSFGAMAYCSQILLWSEFCSSHQYESEHFIAGSRRSLFGKERSSFSVPLFCK